MPGVLCWSVPSAGCYLSPLISSGHLSPLSRIGPGMNWPGRMTCVGCGCAAEDVQHKCVLDSALLCSCASLAGWVSSCRVQPATAGRTPRGMQQRQPWVCRPTHLDLVLAELAIQQPPGIQGCLASLQICTQGEAGGPSRQEAPGVRMAARLATDTTTGRIVAARKQLRGEYAAGQAETDQKQATAGQHDPH